MCAAAATAGLLAAGVQAQQGRSRSDQTIGRAMPRDGQARQSPRFRLTSERARAFARAAREGLDYLPGEAVVRFKPEVSEGGQLRALSAVAGVTAAGARSIGDFVVVTGDEPDAYRLAERLRAQPEVDWAEPNFLARTGPKLRGHSAPLAAGARPNATPNDPEFASRQWNLQTIDMPRAWDIVPGGDPGLIVAIVDGGITNGTGTITFPIWTGSSFTTADMPYAVNTDMAESRIVNGIDLVFFDEDGPVIDMDGHGTHVGMTVAENTNNSLGLAGVAYNVQLMPVKVCLGFWEIAIFDGIDGIPGFPDDDAGGCPFSAIAEGIRYAVDNGAKVINISLGGSGGSTLMRNALQYAVDNGAFVSMSMGNEFEDGNPTRFPASYAPSLNGAMSVSAVGRSLTKSHFSSTGTYNEIAAPGGSIRDGGSSGLVWQSTLRQLDLFLLIPRFDRYESAGFQGTSMAAPHVAGLAALLMSQGITSPSVVEQIIRQSARDLGDAGQDVEYGFGLIQPRAALFGLGIR